MARTSQERNLLVGVNQRVCCSFQRKPFHWLVISDIEVEMNKEQRQQVEQIRQERAALDQMDVSAAWIHQAYREHVDFLLSVINWQSIESAPKEGRIWLFGTAKTWDNYERPNAMVIGYWNEHAKTWAIAAMGQPREMSIEPTLWQALPEAPPQA